MLPLKRNNRRNYVYRLWFNLTENWIIMLSLETWSQIHSFQIDRR